MIERRSIFTSPWLESLKRRAGKSDPRLPVDAMLPDRALLIWQERADLQTAFDLSDQDGRIGLFWWSLLHGFSEMGFRYSEELDAGFQIVNEPFPKLSQASFTPITWLMRELWARSPHPESGLGDAQEQHRCIAHYFAHLLLEANLGDLLTPQQASLLTQTDPQLRVPRLFGLIWKCDPELAERFGSPDSAEFVEWCRGEGARQWPILCHPLVELAPTPRRKLRSGPLKGINLFGHALGRFGIGEDVRMAARTLDAAGIPYSIRNVQTNAEVDKESGAGLQLSESLPYDINLFCMTGISTLGTAMSSREKLDEGRHGIGMWPWELPEWPEVWDRAWDCVDEVWAASQYTYSAYARAAQRPVLHMPMAVVVDGGEGTTRADFGLPEGDFLFGFSFDGLSSLARKNPIGVVTAFREAFPPAHSGVGLVLKGIRADASAPAWRSLQDAIGDDERIVVINESMSRARLLDLYRCLDAFVSLHRSEGFGRNIAEAMLLGKPVIATAHSGNLDFTRHDNAALVRTSLRQVQPGEYPFGTGQYWGEPDLKSAASTMRRLLEDRSWREKLAGNGQAFIEEFHSPEKVAEAWSHRLRSIVEH